MEDVLSGMVTDSEKDCFIILKEVRQLFFLSKKWLDCWPGVKYPSRESLSGVSPSVTSSELFKGMLPPLGE